MLVTLSAISIYIGISTLFWHLLLKICQICIPTKSILPNADKDFTSNKRFHILSIHTRIVNLFSAICQMVYFLILYYSTFRKLSLAKNKEVSIEIPESIKNDNIYVQALKMFHTRESQSYEVFYFIFLAGYELIDTIWCYKMNELTLILFLHHFFTVGLSILMVNICHGSTYLISLFCSLYSSTNVPLNIRWFYMLFGSSSIIPTIAFIAAFLIIRILLGMPLTIHFINCDHFQNYHLITRISCYLTLIMNFTFLLQILFQIRRKLSTKSCNKKE